MKKSLVISLCIAVLAYLTLAAYITVYFMGAPTKVSGWIGTIFGSIGWTLISRYEIKRYRAWKAGQKEI